MEDAWDESLYDEKWEPLPYITLTNGPIKNLPSILRLSISHVDACYVWMLVTSIISKIQHTADDVVIDSLLIIVVAISRENKSCISSTRVDS